MKKLLLTIGTSTAMLAPIASVIACGKEKVEPSTTPGMPGAVDQVWDEFDFKHTIDVRETNITSHLEVEYDINITNFDKKDISTSTGMDSALAYSQLINQIIWIVNNNDDKDITGVTINGIRIDEPAEEESKFYNTTLNEALTISDTDDYLGFARDMGLMKMKTANLKGIKVSESFTLSTFIGVDLLHYGIYKAFDNRKDEDIKRNKELYGVSISGSKLVLNTINFGILEDISNGFNSRSDASFYIAFARAFDDILDDIGEEELAKIKSIEFDTNGTKKEVSFMEALGVETLVDFYLNNTGNYELVSSIDPMDEIYDPYFEAHLMFDPTESRFSIQEWREESLLDWDLDKETLFIFKLIMQYYK